jgi:hypothetical protein
MSCTNCVHYKACMHTRTAILDPYQACLSDKDTEECSDWFTADIQEVKHGKWAIRYEGTYKRAKCYCSVCGKSNGIGGIISNQKKPYCPNCGAKMDLEENENEH